MVIQPWKSLWAKNKVNSTDNFPILILINPFLILVKQFIK